MVIQKLAKNKNAQKSSSFFHPADLHKWTVPQAVCGTERIYPMSPRQLSH